MCGRHWQADALPNPLLDISTASCRWWRSSGCGRAGCCLCSGRWTGWPVWRARHQGHQRGIQARHFPVSSGSVGASCASCRASPLLADDLCRCGLPSHRQRVTNKTLAVPRTVDKHTTKESRRRRSWHAAIPSSYATSRRVSRTGAPHRAHAEVSCSSLHHLKAPVVSQDGRRARASCTKQQSVLPSPSSLRTSLECNRDRSRHRYGPSQATTWQYPDLMPAHTAHARTGIPSQHGGHEAAWSGRSSAMRGCIPSATRPGWHIREGGRPGRRGSGRVQHLKHTVMLRRTSLYGYILKFATAPMLHYFISSNGIAQCCRSSE